MPTQVKRFGSIAILTTVFTGLATTAMLWVFAQASDVQPLVMSVDRLSVTIKENSDDTNNQLAELSLLMYEQNTKLIVGEQRLITVERRCQENHDQIKDCKGEH